MSQQTVHLGPRTLTFFFILLVAIFLMGRSSAQSDPTDVARAVTRIDSLSTKSAKRDAPCKAYFDVMKERTADSSQKEYFASKASAVAALELASKYPGTPVATGAALELFLELYEFPHGATLTELRTSLSRLSDCRSVEYFGVLSRLIDSRTRKFLNTAQVDHERMLILSYLDHETSSGPRFFHQVDKLVDLFSLTVERGLIKPAAESRVALGTLKWKTARIRAESTAEGDFENLEELSAQINQGEEIQDELRQVVEAELETLEFPRLAIRAAAGGN
jgi:hypothetical protein